MDQLIAWSPYLTFKLLFETWQISRCWQCIDFSMCRSKYWCIWQSLYILTSHSSQNLPAERFTAWDHGPMVPHINEVWLSEWESSCGPLVLFILNNRLGKLVWNVDRISLHLWILYNYALKLKQDRRSTAWLLVAQFKSNSSSPLFSWLGQSVSVD